MTESIFPNFDGSNDIFPNSTGPWPWLQKGRKIPGATLLLSGDIESVLTTILQHCMDLKAEVHIISWVKVFRIIPEFRILRLTFFGKSASNSWISQIIIAFLLYVKGMRDNWSFKLEIIICL